MRVRGWYLPGWILSTGSTCKAVAAAGGGSFASRASSPRPRPLNLAMQLLSPGLLHLFAPEHLTGKRQIRKRSLRRLVQVQSRYAVAWGFGKPHVARDDGAIELVAEMLLQVGGHVQCQRVAGVVHRPQQTFDLELLIEVGADLAHGLNQVRQP